VLDAFFTFLKTVEVWLTYEVIWIDQATRGRGNFTEQYRFDRKFFFAIPVGYPVSFRVAFTYCIHPYILLLEEDWLLENMSVPWLSLSIDLLARAPEELYGVLLRSDHMHGLMSRPEVPSCLIPSGSLWRVCPRGVHFTNGAAVYRMSSIRRIFDRYGYVDEAGFANAAKMMGYELSFWNDGTMRPHHVPTRFRHIGEVSSRDASSTCSGAAES
jgi:hypothetical protein